MAAYRITDARFVDAAFSGQGGLYAPGHWHEQGTLVVYAATTSSLALLEWRVHTNQLPVERDDVLITFTLPSSLVKHLDETDLPSDWQQLPPPRTTQRRGMNFLTSGKHLALSVPSIINPREQNLVINPLHPHFKQLEQQEVALLRVD
jgi:RES domain-containing protein